MDKPDYVIPEQKLWAAVVQQAIDDLHSIDRVQSGEIKFRGNKEQSEIRLNRLQLMQDKAKAWFESDAWHIGSFQWCCSVLDFNANCVRKELNLCTGNEQKVTRSGMKKARNI